MTIFTKGSELRILFSILFFVFSVAACAAPLQVDLQKPTTFNDGSPLPANHIDGYWVYVQRVDDNTINLSRYLQGENNLSILLDVEAGEWEGQFVTFSVTDCRGVYSDIVQVTVSDDEKPIAKMTMTLSNPVAPKEDGDQLCASDPNCEVVP